MEQKIKRIPYRNGVDIVIYTCPYCGYKSWEYKEQTERTDDVFCPLCHRPI